MQEFGITAGFFISAEYIDGLRIKYKNEGSLYEFKKNFLNLNDIKKMIKNGHIFGAHTYSHVKLGDISTSFNYDEQVILEKKILNDKLGIECKDFAIPYGKYPESSESLINKLKKDYINIFLSDNRFDKNYYDGMVNRRHFEYDWNIFRINYFCKFK